MARMTFLQRVLVLLIISVLSFGLLGFSDSQGEFQTIDRLENRWKEPEVELSTPELIEKAYTNGEITSGERSLYLAYAIYEYDALPSRFHSDRPWSGTHVVQELKNTNRDLKAGRPLTLNATERVELQRLLTPTGTYCDLADPPNPYNSTNFQLRYSSIGGGLGIVDYANALETTFSTEVTSYGWPEPPFNAANSAQLYPVQVVSLGGGLYGYVTYGGATYTGFIGNNPHTAATETAAYATCMVLNSNYSGFPSGASGSLQATAAHEFVHAIQFGVGDPGASEDTMWIESTATYTEDEVFDSVNDNYNYLWPTFTNCLGQWPENGLDEYSNWLFFRYVAEHTGGVNVLGGGEDVVQAYFNNVAAGQVELGAYNNALAAKGTNLADIYHKYAIAARFLKPCQAGSPYCFEEATAYLGIPGGPSNHGSITSLGGSYTGIIKDNYSLNWIGLPASGVYSVTLRNTSTGGVLRGSLVADTPSGLQVTNIGTVSAGGAASQYGYTPPAGTTRVVAVITNLAQTADNPSSCSSRSYRLSLDAPIVGNYKAYIPLVFMSQTSPGDTAIPRGQVTYRGAPAPNHQVELYYCVVGGSCSSYGMTLTNVSGNYEFSNFPALDSSHEMYVRWWNEDNGNNPAWLWTWACDRIGLNSPSAQYTCNFDIEDIALLSPGDGSQVALPKTFTWQRRLAITDSYEFNLYDSNTGNPWWWTQPPLGYVSSYTLTGLPSGFSPWVEYAWEVWTYGSNGYGYSYWYYSILFTSGGFEPEVGKMLRTGLTRNKDFERRSSP